MRKRLIITYVIVSLLLLCIFATILGIQIYMNTFRFVLMYYIEGLLFLTISIGFLCIGISIYRSEPATLERRLNRCNKWSLEDAYFYLDKKWGYVLWNGIILIYTIGNAALFLMKFVFEDFFDKNAFFRILIVLVVGILISFLIKRIHYRQKYYRNRIIKETSKHLDINGEYHCAKIGESLRKGLLYKQYELILTKDFILTYQLAIPFTQIKRITLRDEMAHGKFDTNRYNSQIICQLKNGNSVRILVFKNPTLNANWSYYEKHILKVSSKADKF